MITIIRQPNQTVDPNYLLTKWQPIINQLKNVPDKHHLSLAFYCENNSTVYNESMLTEALSVINMLHLQNKNVQVALSPAFEYVKNNQFGNDSVPTLEISTPINRIDIESSVNSKLELLRKLSETINDQLKTHHTIVLYNLINNISVAAQGTEGPKLYVTARYKVMDPISETNAFQYEEATYALDNSPVLKTVQNFFATIGLYTELYSNDICVANNQRLIRRKTFDTHPRAHRI